MNLLIALLSLSLFSKAFGEEDLIRLSLTRKKTALEAIGSFTNSRKILEQLHADFEKKKISNASVPLFKYLDSEFYAEVLIGHPGQKVNLIFDTSWPNSWVISKLCPLQNLACSLHNQYDSSTSSSYIANGKKIEFNSGGKKYKGFLSTDLFHVGQVNITNQTFGEIIDIPMSFMFTKADGVLGLAFDTYAIDKVTPFFYNMINQGLIDNHIFSFYMNRDPSTTKGGTVFFGGVEKRHYKGNFTFAQVTKANYWQFHMDGVYVKGRNSSFCHGGCEVIADTSSNLIEGPENEIILLNQYIGARPFYFGRYVVDCGAMSKLPAITFAFSGRNFVLKARDYVQKISFGGVMFCVSSFATSELNPQGGIWSLGGAFLSKFYVQFDLKNQRIGFADALL